MHRHDCVDVVRQTLEMLAILRKNRDELKNTDHVIDQIMKFIVAEIGIRHLVDYP
jgi:hypothetical protein